MNARNLNVGHLGELSHVALYNDDRQISEISYREEVAAEPSYSVRIRSLDKHAPEGATRSDEPEGVTERGRRVLEALTAKGAELGFVV